ncbi:MAG TPA: methyltransferase [Candidatus Paceibacterota bacterium]
MRKEHETIYVKEEESGIMGNVHNVLAHSYFAYFLAFLVSLFLDFLFPIKIFSQAALSPVGVVFLAGATFLILWAQKTSRNFEEAKKNAISKETFCKGPYCYTRSPTHWGLFMLMLGFGIIANAFFVLMFTVISFFVSKMIFLREEERILAEKYGAPYLEYKKSVRF